MLIPKWSATNHTSNLSTTNLRNNISNESEISISLIPMRSKLSALGYIGEVSTTSHMNQSGHNHTMSGIENRKTHHVIKRNVNY